jgi:hypothetical protein
MAKTTGYGVVFKSTISSVLTAIAQVKEIDFPEQEADTVEVTTHDSTGGVAEYIKTGLLRNNKFSMTLVWSPAVATHVALQAAWASAASVAMTIASAGPTETLAFSGLVTKLGRVSSSKGAYECKVEIQPTGVVTITSPA